jgi:hypothetical protein
VVHDRGLRHPATLGAIYVDLHDPVARFVARRVRRREDAEDLVGKVFHQFLEHLGDIDPGRGTTRMFVLSMAWKPGRRNQRHDPRQPLHRRHHEIRRAFTLRHVRRVETLPEPDSAGLAVRARSVALVSALFPPRRCGPALSARPAGARARDELRAARSAPIAAGSRSTRSSPARAEARRLPSGRRRRGGSGHDPARPDLRSRPARAW